MQHSSNRSCARGLAVLEALNKLGSATALDLARESGVPRPTVYRLLQSLLDAGYVGRGLDDDSFQLRSAVRRLSCGFKDTHWISEIATPLLVDLTESLSWACDIATLEGLAMEVQNSTYPIAPLSISYNMVGRHLPVLQSAMGIAYLAFAPPTERKQLLGMMTRSGVPADAMTREPERVDHLIAEARRRGYALRQGGSNWPQTSAIAQPIRRDKRVMGCFAVIWMARIMSASDAVGRCLEPMQQTRTLIEQSLEADR
jgi:IclR family transcriptional regulator, mhp operon transcriptional activator